AESHRMMVAPREQGGASGRTKRRYMKSIVTKSLRRKFVERRRSDGTAERGWITKTRIVNQDEKNVRRSRRSFHRLSKGRFGSLQRSLRYTFERWGWTRQYGSVPLHIRSKKSGYLGCDCKCSHK